MHDLDDLNGRKMCHILREQVHLGSNMPHFEYESTKNTARMAELHSMNRSWNRPYRAAGSSSSFFLIYCYSSFSDSLYQIRAGRSRFSVKSSHSLEKTFRPRGYSYLLALSFGTMAFEGHGSKEGLYASAMVF